MFAIGTRLLAGFAISAFVASAIITGSVTLGILAGVALVVLGGTVLWWISSKIETLLNELGTSLIDFIREFNSHLSLTLTPKERAFYSLSHCHRITIKRMQNIQLHFNGKIVKDLEHFYFPFYNFETPPVLQNKSLLEFIKEQAKQKG